MTATVPEAAACLPAATDVESLGPQALASFREALDRGAAELRSRFEREEPVDQLVRDRARLVDAVLLRAWKLHTTGVATDLALVAVGGYGRGELHPCSDIDIMVVVPGDGSDGWQESIERFVTFLWDIGLEVGHSVRTVAQSHEEAAADLTVATTLMESRFLAGARSLFIEVLDAVAEDRIWNSREFFGAKLDEQAARHRRYHDTAYNLEPNIKGSPGGLRDIQVVGWVAKRHFGADTFHQLHQLGFLTDYEYRKLLAGQTFLWRIRWALHTITGRREDRLLFDHQITIAKLFGYEDASFTLAVEQFMQKYYRTVMELSRLNEMLLQLFQEAILLDPAANAERLNARFQVRNGFLEVTGEEVFERTPAALLEMFKLLQERPELRGVSAHTIRLVRRALPLIDEEFRQNPRHHRLFVDIIRAPAGVTHELRRMNRYGVLGRYIPAFGRVVGRMQYDLFHAYTVDEHTLFVVSNLRRLALARFDHEFPALSRIMQSMPRQELIYLAGLFHDIAKGRGGDHSELGAVDAEAFCLEQGLSRYDARLVAWLVRNHLALSITAQKKDINSPEVVRDFARLVGNQTHLDCLYLLTVCDVRATNPKLWNSWKASLFEDFYESTRDALRRGVDHPVDQEELVDEAQAQALQRMRGKGVRRRRIRKAWDTLGDEYFLRHTPEEIAWHTSQLVRRKPGDTSPLVAVKQESARGGTAVLVYTEFAHRTFATVTAVLDELGLSVLDARITPTSDGRSLDTYLVHENDGAPISDLHRSSEIEAALGRAVAATGKPPVRVTRQAPRQVRMFSTPTEIRFNVDESGRTELELMAGDRPGLLSEVGQALLEAGIAVHAAKIMTIGERAEDVFQISDETGAALTAETCSGLRAALVRRLDRKD
jgi:[protein-PII] uridylyltransferase